MGMLVPEQYGGAGLTYYEYKMAIEELAKVCGSVGLSMAAHNSLCTGHILAFGTHEQKSKWLPKLASGEWIGCFGLTEPDAGSDPAGMRTHAKKVDGGYSLSGSKTWISNAPIADVFVIWAKSEEHDGKIKGFVLQKGNV